uniref:Uncharacterized protein n=1 Tax=Terrapene triunguis TaxID=2587831 RepID=A0A674IQY8_9SAUR
MGSRSPRGTETFTVSAAMGRTPRSSPAPRSPPTLTAPLPDPKDWGKVGLVRFLGNVTILCEGLYPGMEFFLRKTGHPNLQEQSVPDGTMAEFPIANVSREDGGSYTCDYRSITDQNRTSTGKPGLGGCPGLALTACLLCADPSLPRPSISLSPTGFTVPGANVTIRCQGQRRNVMFFLHKPGDLNPQRPVDPAGDGAEFLIPTAGLQHKGKYNCSYRPQSEPFVSSEPSDSVELVVTLAGGSMLLGLSEPGSARQEIQLLLSQQIRAVRCVVPQRPRGAGGGR